MISFRTETPLYHANTRPTRITRQSRSFFLYRAPIRNSTICPNQRHTEWLLMPISRSLHKQSDNSWRYLSATAELELELLYVDPIAHRSVQRIKQCWAINWNIITTPPPRRDGEVSCLSVCLSASIYPELDVRSSRNCYACCLCPTLGPPLAALRYVMHFRFHGWRHICK